MKLPILFVCAAMLLASCTTPHATIRYSAPSVGPVRQSVTTAQTSTTAATAHAKAAQEKITLIEADKTLTPAVHDLASGAKTEVDALLKELTETQSALVDTQTEVNDLEKKVGAQTNQLNTAIDEKNAAITQDAIDKSHAHRLKLYACSLGAALVGFLVFKFKAVFVFLGAYSFIPMLALPALTFGALWLYL